MDSRFDLCYPPKIIADYLDFYGARPNALRVLDSYPHDIVLIPPDAPAYAFMNRQANWKLVYSDHDSALFAKTDSAVAKSPEIPVIGTAPDSDFP